MSGALYNRDIIRLAARLADYPMIEPADATVDCRTSVCGSRITLGLTLDAEGKVAKVGVTPQLCALGQASAAIFASHAAGRTPAELRDARDAVERWLLDADAPAPDWPELEAVSDARAAPSRHASVLIAFRAGADAATQASAADAATQTSAAHGS